MTGKKVRVVVELDENLVRQINRVRDVELPKMLAIIVRFGFNTMKMLAEEQREMKGT